MSKIGCVCVRCGYLSEEWEIMWPDNSGLDVLCQNCWEAETGKSWWEYCAEHWLEPEIPL